MPRPARAPVARERLLTRLGGPLAPVTIVSAPPGFGKTTLVAQLVSTRRDAVAWFQIDRLDSDPRRFVAHLIAAVQEEVPEFGADHLRDVLRREVGADHRDIVRFINAVSELHRPLILVIDDYHEVDNPAVHNLLAGLFDHQPAGLAIVMATRVEPPLPLARLRARAGLTEVGEQDLRFSDREALAFIREGLALDLEESLVTALNQRTEGWAAGLQLAGLSLRSTADAAAFIATFDSRDRLISDYLIQEVLDVQPPDVRQFLLATSILERMNASLAGAVVGVDDGQAILQSLERHNVFLVALDRQREWYRYHHFFADLLRRQLALQNPSLLAACHARASDWYAAHGLPGEAVDHALSIPDDERAAAILERDGWRMIAAMESRQVSAWANRIAEPTLFKTLNRLTVALTAHLLIGNDINRKWIDHAQQLARAGDTDGGWFANALAWARACALARDKHYADAARSLLSMVDPGETSASGSTRTLPSLGRAVAAYWRRDLELARGLLEHAMRVTLDASVGAMYFPAVLNLFEVLRLHGNAEEAALLLQQARLSAEKAGWAGTVGMGWLWYGDGERFYAANDLDAAAEAYRQAIDLTRFAGSNTVPLLATMRLAAIAHHRGDRAGALLTAHEVANTPHRRNASFISGLFDHRLVHMWLVLGRVDEAGRSLAPLALTADDEVDAAREEEHIEFARWLIDCRRGEAALPLLARMVAAAEAGGRSRSVVEIQTLLALARQQEGDIRKACVSLESAVQTAAGFRDHRLFLDAGADIIALLRRIREARRLKADAQWFVDALCGAARPSAAARHDELQASPQHAGEPLTRQELQVLRMLGTGYSNEEIGNALFISANTVKTHLKHVYEKLGVKNRSAAVSRAAALQLLKI